jgi:hypothetical protein
MPSPEIPQREIKPAITIADEALASLRLQVRSLLGLIDTGRKPEPAGIVPPELPNPGPVWKPYRQWRLRVLDEDEGEPKCIFVTTPADMPGDYEAVPVDEARLLAMSILAACDWAENGAPERKRYKLLDGDDRGTAGTFICGPKGA